MLDSAEIIQGSLRAATTSIKPLSLWSATLKTFVATHPVGFLVLTGSTIISYGVYQVASENMVKRKKKKPVIRKDPVLPAESPLPEVEKRDNVGKKESSWNLFKAEK